MSRSRMKMALSLTAVVLLAIRVFPSLRGQDVPTGSQTKAAQVQITPEEAKDHEATGFVLQGNHLRLTCDACHGGKEEPKPDCQSCHKPPHGEKFKKGCQDCHTAHPSPLSSQPDYVA